MKYIMLLREEERSTSNVPCDHCSNPYYWWGFDLHYLVCWLCLIGLGVFLWVRMLCHSEMCLRYIILSLFFLSILFLPFKKKSSGDCYIFVWFHFIGGYITIFLFFSFCLVGLISLILDLSFIARYQSNVVVK